MLWNLTKIIFVLVLSLRLAAVEQSSFSLLRNDGSLLDGYILPPENSSSPIIFAIQGSGSQSSYEWFIELQEQVKPLGLGLVILEKQGVSKDSINQYEYAQTNSLDHRLDDHFLCIQKLQESICPYWNGEIVLLGESEGGMVAGELAAKIPQVKAIMLFATGGGMSFIDEVKWTLYGKLEQYVISQEEIDNFFSCFDDKMADMINDPSPDKLFLGNTYKWWASCLSSKTILSNLLDVNSKVYLVHGDKDEIVPIQSSDRLAYGLKNKGYPTTYQKLKDYGHELNHPLLMKNAFQWLDSTLNESDQNNCPNDEILLAGEVLNRKNNNVRNSQNDTRIWESEIFKHVITRGWTEVEGKVSAKRDDEGNRHSAAEVRVSRETDSGWNFNARVEGSLNQDRNGNKSGEVKAEANAEKKFL